MSFYIQFYKRISEKYLHSHFYFILFYITSKETHYIDNDQNDPVLLYHWPATNHFETYGWSQKSPFVLLNCAYSYK